MHCNFDITDYPFDAHRCNITILVSEAEVVDFLNATWRGPSLQSSAPSHPEGALFVDDETMDDPEWILPRLGDWQLDRGTTLKLMPASRQNLYLRTLTLSFKLVRKPHFMIVNAIVPTAALLAISYFGMFLDRNAAPARTAVHLVPLLMIVNRWSSFTERLPPTDHFTWLDTYILLHISFGSTILILYCMVNYAMHRGKYLKEVLAL